MTDVGIVTAMRMEARCVTSRRLPFNSRVSLGPGAAIWLCGIGAEAAREAAEGLHAGGASALVSFGFAGALDSSLRPGDLMLPDSVSADRLLPIDTEWRSRVRELLSARVRIAGGILAASPHMLASAAAKRELAQSAGARAVDMESGAVAEVAFRTGTAFLAVRAISDPVECSPPAALLGALRRDGSPDPVRLAMLLLRGRVAIGTLLRLGADSRAACATLAAVSRHAGRELGFAG